MKTLTKKLTEYLIDNAQSLSSIYKEFSEEQKSTIRGRLNESIDNAFVRLGKGLYISKQGDSTALIINGDAWEEIKKIESNSIDCIITDSGYTCLNKQCEIGTTRKKDNHIGFDTKDIDSTLLDQMYRVMKVGAHFFSFLPADAKDTLDYNNNFIRISLESGFEFNKRAIWNKEVFGMGYNLRNQHEQIIFLSKGKRRMPCDRSIPDVLSHKRIYAKHRIHVAQKPDSLIEDLIKFATLEGEFILDLFAGSLSLVSACKNTGRNCVSIESDKDMIEKSIKARGLE